MTADRDHAPQHPVVRIHERHRIGQITGDRELLAVRLARDRHRKERNGETDRRSTRPWIGSTCAICSPKVAVLGIHMPSLSTSRNGAPNALPSTIVDCTASVRASSIRNTGLRCPVSSSNACLPSRESTIPLGNVPTVCSDAGGAAICQPLGNSIDGPSCANAHEEHATMAMTSAKTARRMKCAFGETTVRSPQFAEE